MSNDILKESFGTLSESLNALNKLGYTHDFNVRENCLVCSQIPDELQPEDFQIDKLYRFEGATNPDDQAILYAISSTKHDLKGVLVNGYGISADEDASKVIERLLTHQSDSNDQITSNKATEQRPEGDRILNANLVEMDIQASINNLKNETTWQESDRNSITLFKSDSMRIVLLGLHENAELKPHKANGRISVQCISGEIKFSIENHQTILKAGQMIALQPNITHSVFAMKESFFLLTLSMNK